MLCSQRNHKSRRERVKPNPWRGQANTEFSLESDEASLPGLYSYSFFGKMNLTSKAHYYMIIASRKYAAVKMLVKSDLNGTLRWQSAMVFSAVG